MSTTISGPISEVSVDQDKNRPTDTIGFIGLGDQGAPMARAIAEAGWPLRVWARRPAAAADVLEGLPHVQDATVTELAAACDVVGLVLTDDQDVRQILDDQGLLAALRTGGVVVNHGTGDPRVAVDLAAWGARAGHAVLDAPVSGGRPGAERRALTTFVGGDPAAAVRCRPVFETFSAVVAHRGPPGAGQLTKLLNNASLLANLRNAEELLEIGTAMGLEARALVDVLGSGSGTSFALQFVGGPLSPEMVAHLPELWRKDIGHFSDAVRARGLPPTVLEARAHESIGRFATTIARLRPATNDAEA